MVMVKKYETDEERLAARRAAVIRYNHSEKGKASQRRREGTEVAKARYARYRQTDKYAAAQERKRIKDRLAGWPIQTERRRWLRANSPDMVNAWMAVRWALVFGLLVRPDGCERCGAVKRLHAHHHKGYERDHWIDVQWLCSPCHRFVHR